MKLPFLHGVVLGILTLFFSCEKEYSKFSKSESHNTGMDCMTCHSSGEEKFYTAGSVYDSSFTNPMLNSVIKLYTEPAEGGKLKGTIEVDALGNFYSNERIKYTNGIYPTIVGPSGIKKHMTTPTVTGACNSCHGNTESPIWIE
ncbi:hypothetical protein K6119_06785 [Paracrocinitomix mangrovi]|uniref:hypothetical protein n=1 Tax=Paracrocinitomix mangrovi TaxID=2862509 RepID=UPI001C8E64C2|nr:hypothetical protein [Paracrocinitomix mangrovi]UKN03219.1 hypothetical protein K6119_06785 [Paracrocinitomix mangrovi]